MQCILSILESKITVFTQHIAPDFQMVKQDLGSLGQGGKETGAYPLPLSLCELCHGMILNNNYQFLYCMHQFILKITLILEPEIIRLDLCISEELNL